MSRFQSWRYGFVVAALAVCAAVPSLVGRAQSPLTALPVVALAPAAGEIPINLKVDVLNVIPDDAWFVAVLSDVDQTRDTVEAVLRKLRIPFDGTREYADFNDFLERLEGWDAKSTHAFALVGDIDDEPEPLIFVPVTDYKKFAQSLGAETTDGLPARCETFGEHSLIAEKAGFAVFTEESNSELLERVVASNKSIASQCEPIRSWLGKQQIAAAVMPAAVQKGCDEALKGLEELKGELDRAAEGDGEQAKYVPLGRLARDAGQRLVELAREDLTHLTMGGTVSEQKGLSFNGQAFFKPGGKFAQAVKSGAALPADCLRNLPGEQFVMAAAYSYPKASLKPVYDFVQSMLDEAGKVDDLPVDAAKLKDAITFSWQLVEQLHYIAQSQSVSGGGIYDGVYGIYHVDDAEGFLKHNQEGMKKFLAAFDKFKDKLGDISFGEKKVGDIQAYTYTIDIVELMKKFGAPDQPQQEAMMKAMFGGEGKFTFYLAAATKDKVVMSYSENGLKTVHEAAKGDKAGLADDVMIKKSAALLPSDVLMVGYLDLGGYMEMVKKMFTQMMAAQGQAFPLPIPPFPASPPIGYTAKAAGNTASIDMVVPMELMENVRNYVEQMQGLIGAFAPR